MIKPNWSIPEQASTRNDDLDHIREHQQIAIVAAILAFGGLVIGWNLTSTTRNASGFPTVRTYENPATGYKVRMTRIYLGDILEDIIYEADVGSGYEDFDPPKLDNVYDGDLLLRQTQWVGR